MHKYWRYLALALAAVCWATAAEAVPITYTESATVTGTLDGSAFDNALITITGTGDTSGVVPGGSGFFSSLLTLTFTISGVGSGTFTDAGTIVFDNQTFSPPAAGFGDNTVGGSILDTFSLAFATYDLTTDIGPITGRSFIRPDLSYNTTAGVLKLRSAGDSTFTATTVPEPTSLALVGAGLLGWGLHRRRKL